MASNNESAGLSRRQYVTRTVSQTESIFHDETLSSSILRGFASLRDEGRFLDVSLIVEDKKILAHRIVLAAFSPYFNSMFKPEMTESKMDSIKLPNISADIICQLVDFAYTATINISGENVQELLIAADFLRVLSVRQACCDFMKDNLDVTNCMQLLQYAEDSGLPELRDPAFQHSCRYFGEACLQDGFYQMTPELVAKLLASERLCVAKAGFPVEPSVQELAVLKAVVQYLKEAQGLVDVLKWLPVMLSHVRLPLLSDDVLRQGEEQLLFPALSGEEKNQVLLHFQEASDIKQNSSAQLSSRPLKWNQRREIAPIKVCHGPAVANGNEVRPFMSAFCDENTLIQQDRFIYVTGMKLWIRRWDGRPVLGGLQVTYSDGHTEQYAQLDCTENYEFTLMENERITDARVSSGWLVDCLTFTTNLGNTYGPYGGPGGSTRRVSP